MKRRAVVAAVAMLLLSCDSIERRVVTLIFDQSGEHVTVSATTTVAVAKEGTPEYADAEERRNALLAERDAWAVRFQQANPESESVTFERTKGTLTSVDRRATVAVEDLQKFFYDTPVTITTTRGEGWLELNVYAGTSTRATAEQRRIAERILNAYSARAVRYFEAVRSMYEYLDERPQRAEALFSEVFAADNDTPPILSERELSVTDAVRTAAEAVIDTSGVDPHADEIFDLVYNPFPAQVKVIIHGQTLAIENFEKIDSDTFDIKTLNAADAVASLEGRWISPDPIGVAKANPQKNAAELAAIVASMPRRGEAIVTQAEVAAAIVDRMRPAPRYRLRWTTKPRSRAS